MVTENRLIDVEPINSFTMEYSSINSTTKKKKEILVLIDVAPKSHVTWFIQFLCFHQNHLLRLSTLMCFQL